MVKTKDKKDENNMTPSSSFQPSPRRQHRRVSTTSHGRNIPIIPIPSAFKQARENVQEMDFTLNPDLPDETKTQIQKLLIEAVTEIQVALDLKEMDIVEEACTAIFQASSSLTGMLHTLNTEIDKQVQETERVMKETASQEAESTRLKETIEAKRRELEVVRTRLNSRIQEIEAAEV